MILLNGCSFSAGTALKDSKYAYPKLLSEMLDEEIIDLSEESKNNFYMAFELNAWILHKLHNKEQLPRIIIWQHTDCFRNHLPDYNSSGTWKPNDLKSLIGKLSPIEENGCGGHTASFSKRHIKLLVFAGWNMISRQKKEAARNKKDADALNKDWGMSSRIQFRLPLIDNYNGMKDAGSMIKTYTIGDEYMVVHHLQHAINVINLQNLCDKLNIKLINYNYFSYGPDIIRDPIVKELDSKSYVIKDHLNNWGMFNHLMFKRFDQPDGYHFNEAAHFYQANVLHDYIVNNNQLEIEKDRFFDVIDDKMSLYDYTTDHSNQDKEQLIQFGKQTLLRRIYGGDLNSRK